MFIKNKNLAVIILTLLVIGIFAFLQKNKNSEQLPTTSGNNIIQKIDQLTQEKVVVQYVKKYKKLPAYYITKTEARSKGWIAADGNLCEVLPGKAIGGDTFSNREGSLPTEYKRKWFEADLNYKCGRRNADRLLFSSDGLIYVTLDHYKTFEKR